MQIVVVRVVVVVVVFVICVMLFFLFFCECTFLCVLHAAKKYLTEAFRVANRGTCGNTRDKTDFAILNSRINTILSFLYSNF